MRLRTLRLASYIQAKPRLVQRSVAVGEINGIAAR